MYWVRAKANRAEKTGISITAPRGSVARTRYAASVGRTDGNRKGTISSAEAMTARTIATTEEVNGPEDLESLARSAATATPVSTASANTTISPNRLGACKSVNTGRVEYSRE